MNTVAAAATAAAADFSRARLVAKRGRPEGRVSRKPANVISSTFYWSETDFKALSHLDLIARPRYTVGRTFWLGRREKRKVKRR